MAKAKNSLIQKLSKNKSVKDYILSEDNNKGFISTGALVLNVLFSGRLDGGIPIGKMSMVAADSSLGKCSRGDQKFKLAVSDHKYDEIMKFLSENK